jgi:nitrogenase molybdenum-iron protein beta chain
MQEYCTEKTLALHRRARPGGRRVQSSGRRRRHRQVPDGALAHHRQADSRGARRERGRLVDAIADSSAHIHGKKFAIYGDPDLCLGLRGFLLELGAEPTHVLATNGGKEWAEKVQALFDSSPFGKNCHVYPGKDLWHMRSLLFTEPVDFLIGNTYGKYLERDTGTPLIRIGFPIFDRHHHHRYPVWGYQGG